MKQSEYLEHAGLNNSGWEILQVAQTDGILDQTTHHLSQKGEKVLENLLPALYQHSSELVKATFLNVRRYSLFPESFVSNSIPFLLVIYDGRRNELEGKAYIGNVLPAKVGSLYAGLAVQLANHCIKQGTILVVPDTGAIDEGKILWEIKDKDSLKQN